MLAASGGVFGVEKRASNLPRASLMTQLLPTEGSCFLDLSTCLKLRFSGPDALRFLNGQISNDLRKARPNLAIQGSVLTAKGKLNAIVFVSGEAESFFLDAAPEVQHELPVRIERYIVADDVQMEDITETYAIFHLISDSAPSVAGASRIVQANRFDSIGWDIWADQSTTDSIKKQLLLNNFFCDEESAEVFRIERGIPRWGRELTDQIIPIEAGLEGAAVDYSKGCYVGQEVISRIKMSGQTNKRLCGFVSVTGQPLRAGMRLVVNEDEIREAGWITSATRSARTGKEIALGYVKRGFQAVGSHLLALPAAEVSSQQGIQVEIVAIPFIK